MFLPSSICILIWFSFVISNNIHWNSTQLQGIYTLSHGPADKASVKNCTTQPSRELLRSSEAKCQWALEGILGLHCRWLAVDQPPSMARMVIHTGHSWPPLLLSVQKCEQWHPLKSVLSPLKAGVHLSLILLRWASVLQRFYLLAPVTPFFTP